MMNISKSFRPKPAVFNMRVLAACSLLAALGGASFAQRASKPSVAASKPNTAAAKPVAKRSASGTVHAVDRGLVSGRTYTNPTLRFQVTFPDSWLIPGDDFEAQMKKAGFDLTLKAPATVPPATRAKMDRALQKVNVVLTAYRSMPGSADNAIVRISLESLASTPQIKDAVDYIDAMRAQFASMKLPPDMKYSETQAEQLGRWQFAFLDSSSAAGKKRLYATVRGGYAVLFSLSYTDSTDLETLKEVLTDGNFAFK